MDNFNPEKTIGGILRKTFDLRRKLEKRYSENPTFVQNVSHDESDSMNILLAELARRGFHLRFVSQAADINNQPVENLSELHIDDPTERAKFIKIRNLILEKMGQTWLAGEGNKDQELSDKLRQKIGQSVEDILQDHPDLVS